LEITIDEDEKRNSLKLFAQSLFPNIFQSSPIVKIEQLSPKKLSGQAE
jgi:hypothetical protein